MFELKIAYRNLLRRPVRTVLTLVSIILGVSIFFSVNIAADSLAVSLYQQLDPSTYGDVDEWVYLFRGVLVVFSAISLIVCVIIIKNLMEMAKEEQLHEIGVLRAIGTSKFSIFLIFFYQILIISVIGMIIGLFLGYFMAGYFFGPLKGVLSNFLYLGTEFDVYLTVSPLTIVSGMLAGLGIPLTIGMIPAISASRVNVLQTLNPRSRPRKTPLRSMTILVIQLITSIVLIVFGITAINVGFSGLLSFNTDPTMETNFAIITLFIAGIVFISGSILLGAIFLPYISHGLSIIFWPILQKMKKICHRNIVKHSRRTKNTFLMISIALAFLIAMNITLSSIEAGIIPGARMRIGGDVRIGLFYSSEQRIIPLNTSQSILQLEHVTNVCEVKNSYPRENITTCDDFGKNTGERMLLLVINTTTYARMHSWRSIYKYYELTAFEDFIHRLDENGTVIIQQELAESIGKSKGQYVNITTTSYYSFFPATTNNYKVVGIMDVLPGIIFSWDEPSPDYEAYAAVISWNTYFNITGSNMTSTTGYFWVDCDNYNNANTVLEDIKDLYQSLGSPWDTVTFSSEWQYRTILDETVQIREVLNLVLIVFISILYMALVIAMLGLIISMMMSVNQRSGEIGLLRALGISKRQIVQMVAGETLIIGTASLITGIICGLTTAYLLSNIPFLAYVPVIYTVRWEDIFYISLFMTFLSFIASIIPAIKAIYLDIIEAIRKRGL